MVPRRAPSIQEGARAPIFLTHPTASPGRGAAFGDTSVPILAAIPTWGWGPRGVPYPRGPLPAVSMEAASCPFFLAVTYLPLAAFRVMRLSHHSMSK